MTRHDSDSRPANDPASASMSNSQLLNEQIIRSAREGIIVYGTDLRYRTWNPYMERLSGLKAADVLGKHPFDLFSFLEDAGFHERLQKTLNGDSVEVIEFPFHIPTTGMIGWVSDATAPLLDSKGAVTGIISTVRDVTERVRAEKMLQMNEARFRSYIEKAPYGIIVVDHRGKIHDANPAACQITGYSHEEVTGLSLPDILAPESLAEGIAHFDSLKSDGILRSDLWHRRKDGTPICLTVNAVKMSDNRAIGFFRDITEQKKAEADKVRFEAQSRQMQKLEAIGHLAGGMAHEFNNLLGGMMGNAEIALDKIDPSSKTARHLSIVIEAGERAAKIIADLQSFARKTPGQTERVDLNILLGQICEMAKHSLGKRIRLIKRLEAEAAFVDIDPANLQNAILHLAINARDAMENGGDFFVETRNFCIDATLDRDLPFSAAPGNYIQIAISDTGPGMSDEVRRRLFEPFFTTKEVGRGTGLGLAAVYGCVKQHNGYITVHSAPGEGTRFKIYLPVSS